VLRRFAASLFCSRRGFARSTSGASATEFAILAPVLVVMMGGAVDLSGAITASNRATYVAEGIAQMVSQVKGPINADDMRTFLRSAPLFDPDVMSFARAVGITDVEKAVNVVVSSVVFEPTAAGCVSNCTYAAKVVFSAALSDWAKRACGTLTQGTADLSQLPAEAFGPSSLVVVDIETFYRPLMMMFLPERCGFRRTAFFRPRHVEHVNYAQNCSGYPVT
jgi:Flp pilus assembly protein TadG